MPAFRFRVVSLGVLDRVGDNLENPRGVMTSVGALTKSIVSERFVRQGRRENDWPERMVPNVPGLISDFRKSRKPKARRFEGRPVLQDTGRLKGSIDFHVVTPRRVETGSNLSYADTQHSGGDSESEKITAQMQENLWAWLKTDAGKPWKNDLGWLLNRRYVGQTLTIKVRARPFAQMADEDVSDTAEMVLEALQIEGGRAA